MEREKSIATKVVTSRKFSSLMAASFCDFGERDLNRTLRYDESLEENEDTDVGVAGKDLEDVIHVTGSTPSVRRRNSDRPMSAPVRTSISQDRQAVTEVDPFSKRIQPLSKCGGDSIMPPSSLKVPRRRPQTAKVRSGSSVSDAEGTTAMLPLLGIKSKSNRDKLGYSTAQVPKKAYISSISTEEFVLREGSSVRKKKFEFEPLSSSSSAQYGFKSKSLLG
jgi:hypothetical protein